VITHGDKIKCLKCNPNTIMFSDYLHIYKFNYYTFKYITYSIGEIVMV